MKRTLIIVLSAIFCVMLFAGCTQTPAEPTEHVHTLVHNEAKAPTCVNNGILEHWYCPDCNARFSDEAATTEVAFADLEVEELGHTGGTATCTEKAICNVCGAAYGDLAEHTYDEGVVTAPTCTEGGYTTYTCACGHTKQENATEATGHSYDAGVVTAPTCTEAGYTTYTCVCGDSYKDNETAATSHAPNADDGDCTSAITCATCGAVTTPAATHNFGYNNTTCANCAVANPNYQTPIDELAIPDGSKLLSNFNTQITPHLPGNWGSSEGEFSNSYVNYDGRGGVFAMGATGESFAWFNDFGTTDVDLTGMDTITFRIKVEATVRAVWIWTNDGDVDVTDCIPVRDQWTEMTVKLSDLGITDYSNVNITLRFATWNHGAKEYIWLDQAYASPKGLDELAIPEGSKLISDFSKVVAPHIPNTWGSGPAGAYYNSYKELDGRAGVFAMGSNCESFMWYNAVGLNDMDLTGMDTITFRIKVKGSLRTLDAGVNDNMIDLLSKVSVKGEWTEVTIKIADLNQADLSKVTIQFKFATWNEGETEYVWFDQVYASPKDPNAIDELAIPEGSKLITNFSETVTPHIPNTWGSGPNGAYYNSYKELDGRAGVFAMGANAECFMWYNAVGLNDMDLTGMDTITFRLKVKGSLRSLDAGHNDNMIALLPLITVKDEWTEVTIKIADLNQADLSKVTIQFKFATWNEGETEYVWLDQVYASPKSGVEELAIPEGATMIADYSSTVTPHIPGNYGTPALAYYTTHEVYDDRAGVFAMGSTGESFIWYNDFGLNGMDLTGKTTITFRMKVKGSLRALDAGHNDNMIALLPLITVKDEWTEVTINIADLNQADIANITIQFKIATWNEGETAFIWLDQVYAQ